MISDSGNKKLNIVAMFLALTFFFLMLFFDSGTTYDLMALLPLCYFVGILLNCGLPFVSFSTPGLSILNCVYFVKCCIYPLARLLAVKGLTASTISNLSEAILLEAGEIVAIYLTIWAYTHRKDKWKVYKLPAERIDASNDTLHRGSFLLGFICIAAVVVLLLNPSSVSGMHLFFSKSLNEILLTKENNQSPIAFRVLLDWAKIIVSVIVLKWCYQKSNTSSNKRYFLLALATVLFSVFIVNNLSRSSFVLTSLCGLFVICRMYPQKIKNIIVIYASCLVVAFVAFSIIRFGDSFVGNFRSIEKFADLLQAYFCGEKNLAISLSARDNYAETIGIRNIFSDLLGNWMGIGRLFRQVSSSEDLFNLQFYGRIGVVDQIVPTVGQCIILYGRIMAYLYTVVMTLILMRNDEAYIKENRIEYMYLLLLANTKLGVTVMGNFKIFMALVLNSLLPLYIIFYINERVIIKTSKR